MEITLNPGFVLILGALAVLAAPTPMRSPTMAGAAFFAMWLLLQPEFGAGSTVAQMGLAVVPFTLDELNQVFGIAFITVTILIALYTSARRNRYEDAAILLLAGGSVSALFAGDLVSLVAATALAGLAGAWVVFCSSLSGASAAGVRLLIWHGIEGLLLVAGIAFHIASGAENSVLARLRTDEAGGAFIFAALMIRAGAPLAHVWFKDVVSHASGAGGAALSCFSTMVGVYALARLFPAEPILAPIGVVMIAVGAFYAAAEDDLRRAAAYALTMQAGVCLALIGIGSPLALAGAAAHAFTMIFALALVQMAFGGVLVRFGHVSAEGMLGAARAMPVTVALILVGGLAAAAAPGLAPYVSFSVALEAARQWETRVIWVLISVAAVVSFIALVLRPALSAYRSTTKPLPRREAPFSMLLAASLAAFLCLAIGAAPAWLYRLMPTALALDPFAPDRVAPQLELLGASGGAYLVLRAVGFAPGERSRRLLDVDALYSGPIAGTGRWIGVVMLRVYGAWRDGLEQAWRAFGRAGVAWAAGWDQPYRDGGSAALAFVTVCGVLMIIMLASG